MKNSDFEESLGAAIEGAAGALPPQNILRIDVERGGYSVILIDLDARRDFNFDGESIVDEIEKAVEFAILRSQRTTNR